MKKGRNTLLIATTLCTMMATQTFANINAYMFDETTKDATLHKVFVPGNLDPYWFQTSAESFAYQVTSIDTPLHREYRQGDFNPYWFED